MKFHVAVDVMPKEGISDPVGQTIERALPARGFPGIAGVRSGKRIEFGIEAEDESQARKIVSRACEIFLSNPVIEDFRYELRAFEYSPTAIR